jgi:hypothetical protein
MKKIYLYLCGGLGNQLFQYAAARNLAIKNNAQLIVDTKCGFITDFRDFWKFSLNNTNLNNVIQKKNILVFWLYRILKKLFKLNLVFNNFLFGTLINEMFVNFFHKEILDFKVKNKLYLFGYFQSEKYFIENKKIIVSELCPSAPNKKIFLDMKKKILSSNSVAIGLRFYETYSPDILSKLGGVTPIDFYKKAIDVIYKNLENPTFFIFSTKNVNVEKFLSNFEEIKKYNYHIITGDNGFEDAKDNLWLMSHCTNHIISNSTLYWWAAYFSTARYSKQIIISAENYANKDTCLASWKLNCYN